MARSIRMLEWILSSLVALRSFKTCRKAHTVSQRVIGTSLHQSSNWRGWVAWEKLILLIEAEVKKAFGSSALSSSFITTLSLRCNKGWRFTSIFFFYSLCIYRSIFNIFYSSNQIEFHMGSGHSIFFSLHSLTTSTVLLRRLHLLPELNSFFLPELQKQLSAQPDSFPLLAWLSAQWVRLLLYLSGVTLFRPLKICNNNTADHHTDFTKDQNQGFHHCCAQASLQPLHHPKALPCLHTHTQVKWGIFPSGLPYHLCQEVIHTLQQSQLDF